jgi:HlyD family secretion protein
MNRPSQKPAKMNLDPKTCALPRAAWATSLLFLAACDAGADAPSAAGTAAADLHTVTRGPMRISIRESAELKAARETRIRSEVEGQATIIFLVPEGSVVEQGERVVELDVSEVAERRANQAITVERAYATLVDARQNMEILEKELAADEAEARSKLEIAEIDREKFFGRPTTAAERAARSDRGSNADVIERIGELAKDLPQFGELATKVLALFAADPVGQKAVLSREMGELGQQILEQIQEIKLAQQQLAIDEDTLFYSTALHDKNYITRSEFERDKLKAESQRSKVTVSLQQLAIDEDTLFYSTALHDKNYITRSEFERDKLKAESQRSKVTVSLQQLDILIGYTLRKTKIDLELTYNNAVIGLERVRAANMARRAREEAELASREAEYVLAKERLENFDEQLKNAVITAPTPGLVVYAELDSRGREMIQEGSEVRERQTLIILPDVTRMSAELKIQEADIDKIRVGQPASIQVDAFSDKVFTGRVSRVSPVADSSSRWSNNNLKVYKTWVELEGENSDEELRPNMSSTVEILVGEIKDTLTVPVSAVRRQGAVKYVWRAGANGPEAIQVKIGRNTLSHVEITEGIEDGDQIYMAPPPGVLAPEFEQPETIDEVRQLESGVAEPRQTVGAAEPAAEVTFESFQAKVMEKLPAFKEALETDGRRALFMNQELRAAIEADPELQIMQAQMMEQFRNRRGGGGPGGQGGPSGGPGGGRRGAGAAGAAGAGTPGGGGSAGGAMRRGGAGGGNGEQRDG